MGKLDRVKIAEQTVAISEKGYYELNDKIIRIQTQQDYLLFEPEDMAQLDLFRGGRKFTELAETEVYNESVVDTIFNLVGEVNGGKVGVLNFASAHYPGGGFLKGSMAQEEALAYCSNLYTAIKDSKMYIINKDRGEKYYTDTATVCKATFFRDSDFEFVEDPFTVNIVTCPAVNRNKCPKDPQADKIMKKRMRRILKLMIKQGFTTIILGAFGCGVFKNDPELIAEYWDELLYGEGLGYYFERVIFSVLDKEAGTNIKVFGRYF